MRTCMRRRRAVNDRAPEQRAEAGSSLPPFFRVQRRTEVRCPAGIGLSSDLCLCGCADSPLTYGLWLTLFIHLRCHRTVPFLCRSGRRHFQQRIRLREARQIRCRARTRARSSPAGGGGSQAHKKIAKIFDNTVGKLVELPAKHLARMSFSPHSRGHTSDRLAGGGDDIRHHQSNSQADRSTWHRRIGIACVLCREDEKNPANNPALHSYGGGTHGRFPASLLFWCGAYDPSRSQEPPLFHFAFCLLDRSDMDGDDGP